MFKEQRNAEMVGYIGKIFYLCRPKQKSMMPRIAVV